MDPLIRIKNLKKYFEVKRGIFVKKQSYIHAVDDVSIDIQKKEILGLVGESGCGKTTLGRVIAKLEKPTDGSIYFRGENISELNGDKLMEFRKHLQMIFQDPYESLNPRFTVFDSVVEPLVIQNIGDEKEREERVYKALKEVGLVPPEEYIHRYPHEISGGQRQRVCIARALVTSPDFIVADEPTSMLDVSLRAGVMNLMLDLKREHDLTYIFITHDLAVARYMTNNICVMYLGKMVEYGPTESIIQKPLHPYTKALVSAVPVPDPTFKRERFRISGQITTPIDPPDECRFLSRCPYRKDKCKEKIPELREIKKNHWVACYFAEELEGE